MCCRSALPGKHCIVCKPESLTCCASQIFQCLSTSWPHPWSFSAIKLMVDIVNWRKTDSRRSNLGTYHWNHCLAICLDLVRNITASADPGLRCQVIALTLIWVPHRCVAKNGLASFGRIVRLYPLTTISAATSLHCIFTSSSIEDTNWHSGTHVSLSSKDQSCLGCGIICRSL